MTSLFALAHGRLLQAYATLRDREEGQGMTEYVVMVVLVVAIAVAVMGALSAALTGKLTGLIDSI